MNEDNMGLIKILLISGGIILVSWYFFFYRQKPLNNSQPEPSQSLDSIEPSSNPSDTMESMNSKTLPEPEMQIDVSKDYKAVLKTNKGDITIDLNEKETPITVNNFVYLAENSFYNDVIFHRVLKGFMIQGGDPTGTGAGSPGYRFDDEPFTGEYSRGTIAMANAGPNTNGSQFFIMHQDYSLPSNYVIFGKVTEGLDVVDAIAESEVELSSSGEVSKPVEPAVINSVEIIQ